MKKRIASDSVFYAPHLPEDDRKEFYSALCHVFRGPLVGACGYVDYLFKGYAGSLTREQMKQLSSVRESILQLESIIDSFLDICAFEMELIEPGNEQTDVCAQIGKISLALKENKHCDNVILDITAKQRPLIVKMSEQWVNTMLFELVSGSLRFLRGKGSLSISLEAKKNMTVIEIKDLGPKLPKGRESQIFRPFFQLKNGVAPHGGRRGGLGLCLAKKIVLVHKGRIKVSSIGKSGFKIRVELPMPQAV